jgi:hypothetical protein
MKVYINYPNPHFTIHKNTSCSQIKKNQKTNQREIIINSQNLPIVLRNIIMNCPKFSAEATYNDLWLDITLDTREQEFGLVYIIQLLFGLRYTPLRQAKIIEHNCRLVDNSL